MSTVRALRKEEDPVTAGRGGGEPALVAVTAAPAVAAPIVHNAGLLWLRSNGISMVLWVISIGMLLGIWYIGTKYKLEFYIRFTNVPTPGEVLQCPRSMSRGNSCSISASACAAS